MNIDNKKKTIMYIHGFLSSPKGITAQNIIKRYSYIYNVVCPEVDGDPINSLEKINKLIDETNPFLIIGTSLGGFYALSCNNVGRKVIVINPSVNPLETLKRCVGITSDYHCEREDGKHNYTLTEDVLNKFKDVSLINSIEFNKKNIFAICSNRDELLRDSHIKFLTPLLNKNSVYVVESNSHRINESISGILYDAIENVAETIRENE